MSDVQLDIKIDFDISAIVNHIKGNIQQCQKVLDAQVLKDSNFYCPMQTGVLQKSGILHTVIGSGSVIWNTPYAHEQYYRHPNKSHQKNPNATMKWFEVAKSKRIEVWKKVVNDEYNRSAE